jgi:hypothetical protein
VTLQRTLIVALLAVTLAAGCKGSSWDHPTPNSGPLSAPSSPVAAACPLLPAERVAAAFGLSGVRTREEHKTGLPNGVIVSCAYRVGYSFSMVLGVQSLSAKGSAGDVLSHALSGDAGEQLPALGDAAAYHTPAANVGQVAVVKQTADGEFRVVSLTGDATAKDKLVALARDVLQRV